MPSAVEPLQKGESIVACTKEDPLVNKAMTRTVPTLKPTSASAWNSPSVTKAYTKVLIVCAEVDLIGHECARAEKKDAVFWC